MAKQEKYTFPAVLWILPIVFGVIGGTVAALIANLKYQASWWELFVVGVIINVLVAMAWGMLIAC